MFLCILHAVWRRKQFVGTPCDPTVFIVACYKRQEYLNQDQQLWWLLSSSANNINQALLSPPSKMFLFCSAYRKNNYIKQKEFLFPRHLMFPNILCFQIFDVSRYFTFPDISCFQRFHVSIYFMLLVFCSFLWSAFF